MEIFQYSYCDVKLLIVFLWNPMQVYVELSPTVLIGIYSQKSVRRYCSLTLFYECLRYLYYINSHFCCTWCCFAIKNKQKFQAAQKGWVRILPKGWKPVPPSPGPSLPTGLPTVLTPLSSWMFPSIFQKVVSRTFLSQLKLWLIEYKDTIWTQ